MGAPAGEKTFVGFGFGPIQSGLFLLEAWRSGNFGRRVVAEVDPTLVEAVRRGGNRYTVNIACADRIETVSVDHVEIFNPAERDDRQQLIDAVTEASEMATALPSVDFYSHGGDSSVAAVLADGVTARARPQPTIIYAAENNNHAAERLTEALVARSCDPDARQLQALNTVIGKMSGVVDAPTIASMQLSPLTPGSDRAVLVEAFNHILVSRVRVGTDRGIHAFVEKADLLPFEEAKLYGHNAVHALIGYLAARRGLETMAQAAGDDQIMSAARDAFLHESRPAMLHRHGACGDPLFTEDGYAAYAEDLLERMVCPFLNDRIRRVTRDPLRKLGWNDRIFGTMRLALEAGVRPVNMARAAAAAVDVLAAPPESPQSLSDILHGIWGRDADERADLLIDLTANAMGDNNR